jgi:hypothetical protein
MPTVNEASGRVERPPIPPGQYHATIAYLSDPKDSIYKDDQQTVFFQLVIDTPGGAVEHRAYVPLSGWAGGTVNGKPTSPSRFYEFVNALTGIADVALADVEDIQRRVKDMAVAITIGKTQSGKTKVLEMRRADGKTAAEYDNGGDPIPF